MKGNYYHLNTPEDYQLVFANEDQYKIAMAVLALCCRKYSEIVLLAFQFMSNHVHLVLYGTEENIMVFWECFRKNLLRALSAVGGVSDLHGFDPHVQVIETLDNLMNAIAYTNRNAFVVSAYDSPFSYPWGTGRYYFNHDALMRYNSEKKPLRLMQRRGIMHTRDFEDVDGVMLIDGYASPFSFCDIATGEALFQSARNYFLKIARNVEAYTMFAQSIGEKMFYSDEDLFTIVVHICKSKFKVPRPSLLSIDDKLMVAKKLHYDYNASNKQIARILKMTIASLDQMFPKR